MTCQQVPELADENLTWIYSLVLAKHDSENMMAVKNSDFEGMFVWPLMYVGDQLSEKSLWWVIVMFQFRGIVLTSWFLLI